VSVGKSGMNKSYFGLAVVFVLLAIQGCRAPSPDWNGTWKLNPTKSSYRGQVLTISISADGEYRFDESTSHTLHCDGKDRPTGNNRTLLCTRSGVTALDITLRENGVKTRITHDELSTDGKVFTTTVTEFQPNGPVVTSQITFTRLSGADGFAGQWRDTSYLQQHADMTLRLDSQTLYIGYPSVGQKIDAPLNGVETAVRGPHIQEGSTFAIQPAGRREFRTITKREGKLFSQGSLELSKDGKSIANFWWNPSQPDDKGTLIYDKQ
jgi:hypothetical protein